MNKYIYLLVSALLAAFFFSTCKDTDLTPVYIHVTQEDLQDRIDVSDFNATHDENFDQDHLEALTHHKFTHVNVYVNNKNLGCWELPCKVPALDVSSTDTSTLVLIPAFPVTGMSNTIWGYPFLNICRQKVVLKKGTTYEVADNPPTYVYSEYAKFPYFETFSNSTSFTTTDTAADALTLLPTTRDGRKVGELVLTDDTYQKFDIQSPKFVVPVGSYRVVLEITYKTDCAVDVAMKMSASYNPYMAYSIGGFYASPDEWKTIHFDMTSTLNNYHNSSGNATEVNLVLSGAGEDGKVSRVSIDDIKVIYIRTA